MALTNLTPKSLIAEITEAFDGVPRDGGITLHEAEELDCRGTPDDCARARLLDTDTRWQDVPDEWIGQFPSAFTFMNALGLRYYLAPVMIWHFRHLHWSEPASADCLHSLLMGAHRELPELFNLLTESQRRATSRWLFYYVKDIENSASEILASCWEKYLRE